MSQARTPIRLPGAAARPRPRADETASAEPTPDATPDPAPQASVTEPPVPAAADAATEPDTPPASAPAPARGRKRKEETDAADKPSTGAPSGHKMALDVVDLGHASKQQANVYLPDVLHDHYDRLVRDLKRALPRKTSISEVYTALLSEGPATAEELRDVVLRHRARQGQDQ